MRKLQQLLPALILFIAAFSFFNLLPSDVSAQGITNPAIGQWGDNTARARSGFLFSEQFIYFWRTLITIGGLMTILFFLWGAVEWITAGGDSGKIEKARNRITQAIIGLLLLVTSFALIEFIGNLAFDGQFSILELTFPTPN